MSLVYELITGICFVCKIDINLLCSDNTTIKSVQLIDSEYEGSEYDKYNFRKSEINSDICEMIVIILPVRNVKMLSTDIVPCLKLYTVH